MEGSLAKDVHGKLERRWQAYLQQVPEERKTLSNKDTRKTRSQLHATLSKATSTLVTQIRTEKISLNAFLTLRRVPGVTATCHCGWGQQTAKHVLLFYPSFAEGRAELLKDADTNDYSRIVATTRGVKAAAQFMQQTGLLPQFQLGL